MKVSRIAIAFYLLLVFISGALVGAFGYRLYTVSTVSAKTQRDPMEYRRRLLNEMQKRLNLSTVQVQKLNTILDDMRVRYHDAHEHTKQVIKAEQDEAIRGILDNNQKIEYEKMQQERQRHQRQQTKPNPSPGI
ncbi:MAG TPA: hypothetical protein VKV15_18925 [Bryobacteraceae bacterium]|nr:hypothetical protein [Bryobacteraceae bacterium]